MADFDACIFQRLNHFVLNQLPTFRHTRSQPSSPGWIPSGTYASNVRRSSAASLDEGGDVVSPHRRSALCYPEVYEGQSMLWSMAVEKDGSGRGCRRAAASGGSGRPTAGRAPRRPRGRPGSTVGRVGRARRMSLLTNFKPPALSTNFVRPTPGSTPAAGAARPDGPPDRVSLTIALFGPLS